MWNFVIVAMSNFLSENTISSSFTAECAENAEASETPNVDWNGLKLCALGDLRGDKSLCFYDRAVIASTETPGHNTIQAKTTK